MCWWHETSIHLLRPLVFRLIEMNQIEKEEWEARTKKKNVYFSFRRKSQRNVVTAGILCCHFSPGSNGKRNSRLWGRWTLLLRPHVPGLVTLSLRSASMALKPSPNTSANLFQMKKKLPTRWNRTRFGGILDTVTQNERRDLFVVITAVQKVLGASIHQ